MRAAVLLLILQSVLPGTGVVERVIDGDTLVLHRIGAVRLIGVDTPESKHPQRPVEAFAAEATAFLATLVEGQAVRIEYDQTVRDRYGRLLAYLYLDDGRCVYAEIIRQGFGFAYTRYPFRYLDEFLALEREARTAARGLWATPGQPKDQR